MRKKEYNLLADRKVLIQLNGGTNGAVKTMLLIPQLSDCGPELSALLDRNIRKYGVNQISGENKELVAVQAAHTCPANKAIIHCLELYVFADFVECPLFHGGRGHHLPWFFLQGKISLFYYFLQTDHDSPHKKFYTVVAAD